MKTLDCWVDLSMRQMRQKYRNMFNAWVGNDINGIMKEAEDIRKSLGEFIDHLKREEKERET